jgi:hypothetical protein
MPRTKLTPRERRIISLVRNHLPDKLPPSTVTGSPLCGLLDVLDLLGVQLPYRLEP